MNCNVHVFCKMIFSNKFGFILETVFSFTFLKALKTYRLLFAPHIRCFDYKKLVSKGYLIFTGLAGLWMTTLSLPTAGSGSSPRPS
jgi:hypothetical protein